MEFKLENHPFLHYTNICGQTCIQSDNYLSAPRCILFFTGNPSLLAFYIDFCEMLHEQYPDNSILVVSLHCTPMNNVFPSWKTSLCEVVKVKLNLIDWVLRELPQTTHFLLLTHSLGAFVALHVLPQRPELEHRVDQIIHLFPAIRDLKHSIDLIVRLLARLTLIYPLISMTTYLLKLLPLFIFTLFIQLVSTTPPQQAKMMQQDLNPHHIAQVAYFTLDEEEVITDHDKQTQECLLKTSNKTTVVFGQFDKYTPLWIRNEFKERYPDVRVIETTIKHAFVLGKSKEMFDFLKQNNVLL
ncbi:hypothetical protein ENUP19_0261G0017 [Entamoeba nuttalli]|uniref:Lipid droplet-associated hydrolase n=2 Tax=Entamoeba nuttalli TaxID=412467 RepID=K2H0G2_ENTNP|nr:hypothetical protein ENU1_117630 [Entamoeba nuttalli P19]EKE39712.1 hypothetical protein ENU1_117630 [Entamoeba nuttalli P19]|eukprot:XP_008857952.1 hypothetical protein ENU1_117630 [Entamoeba nuttalli P19]